MIFIRTLVGLIVLIGFTSSCSTHPWAKAWYGPGTEDDSRFWPGTVDLGMHLQWQRDTDAKIFTDPVISSYQLVSINGASQAGCSAFTFSLDHAGRKDFCRPLGDHNATLHPLADQYGDIYQGFDGQIRAYDWFGPIRWRINITGYPVALQFAAPGIIAATLNTGQILLLDAHVGQILARTSVHAVPLGIPAINTKEHKIYIATQKNIIGLHYDPPKLPASSVNNDSLPVSTPTPLPSMDASFKSLFSQPWQHGFLASPSAQLGAPPDQQSNTPAWPSSSLNDLRGDIGKHSSESFDRVLSLTLDVNHSLLLVSGAAGILAVDSNVGSFRWNVDTPQSGPLSDTSASVKSPSLNHHDLFVTSGVDGIDAIRIGGNTITKVWHTDLRQPGPVLQTGQGVVVTTSEGDVSPQLIVLDGSSGNIKKTWNLPHAKGTPMGLTIGPEGNVVVVLSSGTIYNFHA